MDKLTSMTTVRVLATCGFLFGIQTSLMATYNGSVPSPVEIKDGVTSS